MEMETKVYMLAIEISELPGRVRIALCHSPAWPVLWDRSFDRTWAGVRFLALLQTLKEFYELCFEISSSFMIFWDLLETCYSNLSDSPKCIREALL